MAQDDQKNTEEQELDQEKINFGVKILKNGQTLFCDVPAELIPILKELYGDEAENILPDSVSRNLKTEDEE